MDGRNRRPHLRGGADARRRLRTQLQTRGSNTLTHAHHVVSDGLRIGITIGLQHEAETLWSNGIKQNAVFLAETLKRSSKVRSVYLVNTTAVAITHAIPWDLSRWPVLTFDQAKDGLDVLIELGGQIDAVQTDHFKRQGTRLVSYCCGVEYVNAMEAVLFNRTLWGHQLFVNQRYDDIWMVPQVANISRHYFETLRRRPARVVPFVWDPVFLQERSRKFPAAGEYRPRPGPRRLSVMEPNHNVVKFCLYPILIAEEAYRLQPDKIAFLHVTNAERLAKNSPDFVAIMSQLDIVRQHKAAFVGRYETPQFLSEMTDVMISHQWENPLNYFYLEVCWQGYPLVHNSDLCQDLGYYYAQNDVQAGCRQLLRAIADHDDQWESYRERQRRLIARYLPANASVVAEYEDLLLLLMQQTPI